MAFWGIKAKNDGQRRAVDALLNDKPFLFLTGPAGTGKTLITQAVGLYRTVDEKDFRKLNYTRLQEQLGKELGFLTGDIDAKTYPFIRPFLDNFELLSNKNALTYLISGEESKRKVFFDPVQTLRGASIHYTFCMYDEAQNFDLGTITGIATRPALGTKMIFLGNFSQIDAQRIRNPETNGLYKLLDGLYREDRNKQYFDHVNLTEIERHPVVELVERILREDTAMNERFSELESRGN